MSKILYIMLMLILFSCKSNNSIAQEKEKNNPKNTSIQKPKFGDPNNNDLIKINTTATNQIPPNTVYFNAVVLQISENEVVCDISNTTIVKVRVKQVVGTGSGIVNMLSSNQETVMVLGQNTLKNRIALKEILGKEIFIVSREKPCYDFSQTVYEIVSFEPKN
ncbi:hypothetical protein ACWGOQ_0018960 [Aquimarina sp. M1]